MKKILTMMLIVMMILVAACGKPADKPDNSKTNLLPDIVPKTTAAEPADKTKSPVGIDVPNPVGKDIPKEYKEAFERALDYLESSIFSKSLLYKQLLFENFSEAAAQFAVDRVPVDWNEQALRQAEDILSRRKTSKEKLFNSLAEDFLEEEARYAADNVNVDWKEQAVELGKIHKQNIQTSKAEMQDFLLHEKFTQEEADYAVAKIFD